MGGDRYQPNMDQMPIGDSSLLVSYGAIPRGSPLAIDMADISHGKAPSFFSAYNLGSQHCNIIMVY
jgi:hypothetical protein